MEWKAAGFRWIGLVPIANFLARLIQYIQVGTPDWIAYSCHVSTLALGLAMIFGWPPLIRITSIWLVIGLPMWLIDAYVTQVIWAASIVSHLGGFLLAIYAMRAVRATGRSWLPALAWFVGLQFITRYTTAPELNVNIAHSPYQLWRGVYSSWWTFLPVCTLVVALMVWIVEMGLVRLYPLNRVDQISEPLAEAASS